MYNSSYRVATLPNMKVATSSRVEVGVRDQKNNQSRYHGQEEAGIEVVVTDRGRPVARLTGMSVVTGDKLAAMIEAGLVRPPAARVRQRPVPLTSTGSVRSAIGRSAGNCGGGTASPSGD